jgi:ribosomal-protein-alanine N-acetyltransferase
MSANHSLRVQLRPMTLDDLAQVQCVDRETFNDPWPRDAFLYELKENEHSICWVAEVDDENDQKVIVGFVVVWLIVDEAHIGTLAVKPKFRGGGVGRRLLATALLESCQAGAQKSLLEVRLSNIHAQHLYYGLGFEVVGLRSGYYPDNHEDALLMTLKKLDEDKLMLLATA